MECLKTENPKINSILQKGWKFKEKFAATAAQQQQQQIALKLVCKIECNFYVPSYVWKSSYFETT